QVREQTDFLKHIAQRTPVRREEQTTLGIEPCLAADGDAAGGSSLQVCNTAQQSGLAGPGVTEDRRHPTGRQACVDLKSEVRPAVLQAQIDTALAGIEIDHYRSRWRELKVYSANSTRKLNSSMPPDSQCAWVYSSAST